MVQTTAAANTTTVIQIDNMAFPPKADFLNAHCKPEIRCVIDRARQSKMRLFSVGRNVCDLMTATATTTQSVAVLIKGFG